MPSAASRYCTCGQHVVQAGSKCPCAKARKIASDRARPSARTRGYDREWQRARHAWLVVHPSCVGCGQPATLVDHIITIRNAPHRRLDPTNFQSMCSTCHGRKTAEKDGSFGRR
ncbi:HNH endonuclease [Pseudochrobactrum sp. MP213Fo]|uniref:HNH endonuclease n=1 Tax=Pseudochrobactrum sp. MP213Fo TaxID=3022250 RepID=UPI003BA31BD2